MTKKSIYLDYAATTPVDPRVLQSILPFLKNKFGNASSLHAPGLEAREAVEEAREKVAGFLGCRPDEIYFTSGATESDNWAVLGLIRAIRKANPDFIPHLIASAIEHEAILEPLRQLEKEGIQVTYLPVNKQGLIRLETLRKFIKANTVLVSIMYANNEVGTIQPIAEIGWLIAKENSGKRRHHIYFHTDATQAPAYCDCRVAKLGVDLLSLSAHKIYGPKGVGALYVKRNTPIESLLFGGGQQEGKRSGTYNVAGIVGLGKAIELIGADKKSRNQEIKKLRDYLIRQIQLKISRTIINGDLSARTPNNAHFIFPGVEGESVLLLLSQKGIAVSTGSACSSGSLEPSHVLLALGIRPELAHGSIRVTLGRFTTKKEIAALIKELPPIIKKLRAMSPLKEF